MIHPMAAKHIYWIIGVAVCRCKVVSQPHLGLLFRLLKETIAR